MKYNFEKIKNIATKTAIGAGILGISVTPLKSTGQENIINNLKNNTEKSKEGNSIKETDSIHFTVAQEMMKNEKDKLKQEDIKIIENIKKLEEKFSKLSNGETEIMAGSLSILSERSINNNVPKNNSNVSALDNRYITDMCSFKVFNEINNLKLMDKDFLAMKDAQELQNNGFVNLKNGGYTKHFMPEFYFIITQNIKTNNTIEFKIKIIHSKQEKIEEMGITENLPSDDVFEIENFVNSKIIPDLSNIIKEKISELGLSL